MYSKLGQTFASTPRRQKRWTRTRSVVHEGPRQSHGSRDFRNRRSNGASREGRGGGKEKKWRPRSGGTLWAVRPLDRQINGPCGGKPNANCNTGCWKGYGGPTRGASRQAKMDCYWPRIQPFGPRHSHDMLTSAWTRSRGMKPFARKGLEGWPKIQSLGVSAATMRSRTVSDSLPAFDSDRPSKSRLNFLRSNTNFRFFLRTKGKKKKNLWWIPINLRSHRSIATWIAIGDNCTRAICIERIGSFKIMCFFNEVVELFSLKRTYVKTLLN